MKTESLAQCSSYFSSIMFGSIWNRSSKNYKIINKKETITLRCSLMRKKNNFRGFWVIDFGIYPKWKLRNLRKFYLLEFLVAYGTQNQKIDLKEKTVTLRCGLRRKNVHFRDLRVFDFALYLKPKTWKPRKVLVYFNFLSFWLH